MSVRRLMQFLHYEIGMKYKNYNTLREWILDGTVYVQVYVKKDITVISCIFSVANRNDCRTIDEYTCHEMRGMDLIESGKRKYMVYSRLNEVNEKTIIDYIEEYRILANRVINAKGEVNYE